MTMENSTKETNDKKQIFVCAGTGCVSSKSLEIYESLKEKIAASGLGSKVEVGFTGCHGFCQKGPIVVVEPEHIFYSHVKLSDTETIIFSHILNNTPVEKLFYTDPLSGDSIAHYPDIPFYKKQHRIILSNCGKINPERIEDYMDVGGYRAQKKVLSEMSPGHVIEEIKRSGLRGRGGAGFSTGLKWEFCRREKSDEKYIVCNADEGDPGAFMDRSTLEADPHKVLEGMVIAAYAIGASKGYIYLRAEYPLAIKRFHKALEDAEKHGFLGEGIMGSNFNLRIKVKEGAGAFVCGEETGLIASIMGERGMPRPRPPFPANSGIHGKPTNINNVKTLASVPMIISKGSAWFSSIGTEKSPGTAVFALTGKIANSGLVEVPMGTALRKIIFEIGGGIPEGKEFKAVQTGGPSGGCLPASHLDLPADYESLTKAGSIMGSGGMVVLDEDSCMVDIAHYFLSFTQEESCGKCPPCRVGTKRMLEILTRIKEGEGEEEDIKRLEELAPLIKKTSLCALGGTAPNPVLTTLKYFRNEYEAHILEGRCPARSCKAFISYTIDAKKCIGCDLCRRHCPVDAITGEKGEVHVIDEEICVRCGMCYSYCPPKVGAVQKVDRTGVGK